jgi:heme/copper-type cytochrome/quinol oxidase subunit 1
MSLIASPSTSAAIDHAVFDGLADPAETWFTSVDHRTVGRLLTGAALLMGVVGTSLLALLSGKLDAFQRGALSTADYLGGTVEGGFSFARINTMVGTGLPYFVVLPLFLGVATAVVPHLIGGRRMAFPRLQAFVLWGYVVAAGTFIASFTIGDGPPAIDVLSTSIPNANSPANRATDLLIGSLVLVTIITILGALNILVTVVTQRPTGTRLADVRPFAFASMVTSGVLLLASPVFLAGLLLLEMDQHVGGGLFGGTDGATRVWSHMIWLNGRPEALLLLLPALGAVVDVVAARVSVRPIGGRTANGLLGFYGVATLTAWAVDSWNMNHMVQPTSTLQASLVAIPLGLLAVLTLGTVASGVKNLKMDASLIFAIATELLVVLAVVNIAVAAIRGVTDPNAVILWGINQSLLVIVAAPLVGLLAAAIEYIPRSADRRAHVGASSLGGLAVLAGFAVYFIALAVSWYRNDLTTSASALSVISVIGGLVAAAGIAITGLALASAFFTRSGDSATVSEAGH